MDHEEASEVIKRAITELLEGGFPKEDVPPLLADWTAMTAMADAGPSGIQSIIYRLRKFLEDAAAGEYGEASKRSFEPRNDTKDFSGLRIAMEHLLSHQGVSLDQAAAFFVVYALGLVHDHMGPQKAQAVLNTGKSELTKLKKEAPSRNLPLGSKPPI